MTKFGYRPHLDGLRAVAVLFVFVFHAAPPALPGGFIGVDVFFVLSGFLITSILLGEHESGNYSPGQFYSRRIRRLLPASLALLLFVAVVTTLYGSSLEFQTRLREIRATVFYVANWNLIATSDDYFAEGFSASPLRHMWSLAVEEQFYFVWPLLLSLLIAWLGVRRRLLAPVLIATAVSTALMIARYDEGNVARSYYGTDTRVFQPLIGAALAIALYRRRRSERNSLRTRAIWTAFGVLAAVGLAFSATYFDGSESTYFHWGAVAVALVTVLLIVETEVNATSWVARGLSWRPLVLLGTISYGFYIWHWPIIVWLRSPENADFLDRRLTNLLQLLATLAAATASYHLLETPIRRPTVRPRVAITGAAVGMAVVVAVAGAVLQSPAGMLTSGVYSDRSFRPCPNDPEPCVKVEGATPDAPTVVLVGDSTSQAFDPAMEVLAKQYGFRYVQAAVGGCPIGHRLIASGKNGELHQPTNLMCYDQTPNIYDQVVHDFGADLIIATAFNEARQHVTDGELVKSGTPQHLAETEAALNDSIDVLTDRGAEFALIDLLPPGPTVACLDSGDSNSGSCLRQVDRPNAVDPYNDIFQRVADSRDDVAGTISFEDELCPDDTCPLTIDGIVVRYDGTHFTGSESVVLAPLLDAKLRAIGVDLSAITQSAN